MPKCPDYNKSGVMYCQCKLAKMAGTCPLTIEDGKADENLDAIIKEFIDKVKAHKKAKEVNPNKIFR